MDKYQLEIVANGGYASDQVENKSVSVGDLRDMLSNLNEDDIIVLQDSGNRYGASYGYITGISECDDNEEDMEQ